MASILFADDEPHIRNIVSRVLTAAGHSVRLASEGASALAEIRRIPPDMAVLDYRMGKPDGLDVCRAIKRDHRLAHLPVLILTGHGDVENRLNGFDAGADDYLAKPFDPRELVARVGALLRLSRRGLDRNPTSGLPGGQAIQREFARWHEGGGTVAICYLDLDHFKPFSERFGFAVADTVISDVGDVLSAVVATAAPPAFAGHVGGDDFVILAHPDRAVNLVRKAQKRFETAVRERVPLEVAEAGFYRAEDRDGTVRDIPMTRLSAAVVRVPTPQIETLDLLGERISAAKQAVKREEGPSGGLLEMELADLPAPRSGQ